jgi:hypothetical protein
MEIAFNYGFGIVTYSFQSIQLNYLEWMPQLKITSNASRKTGKV